MKPSVKDLQKRITELEQKCEDLEKINRNMFDSEEDQINQLKAKIEAQKKGAGQLSKAANSIYKWAAHVNGGMLRVPINHMDITDKWEFKLTEDMKTKEYVLEVWGDME